MYYLVIKHNLLINNRLFALKISVLIFVNILFGQHLFSQQLNDKAGEFNNSGFMEELYIRTDRDIYITGEEVWFKVYKMNRLTHAPCDISKVVYMELLDKNNFPLKQLKVKIECNSGSSGFRLPDNISSGNYVIRAYTNWMKNWPADLFYYTTISVINPFENIGNLLLPTDKIVTDYALVIPDSLSQLLIIDQTGNKQTKKSFFKESTNLINYTITFQKPDFSLREKVVLVITATDMAGNSVETDISVSVAKSAIVNSSSNTSFKSFNQQDSVSNKADTLYYLAELEGPLINGYIRLKATDEPLKKTDISLSYVGKTARCQFGRTNENGEFYFVVKEPGLNEIVIQPLSPEITGYYVELNESFSSTFASYNPPAFYPDSSKISQINNAIISMQINNVYVPFRQNSGDILINNIPDFYGKPENTIKMSDYIQLTSLREVVKEIIPNVYTLKQNGKYDFKLINKFRGQPFENKPLILVDGVPIYDFEKVLNINSKEIERADVINTRYFISEYVFDGIVSFITQKGNLSVLEFDNSIFRQVNEACQIQNDFYSPVYSNDLMKDNRIPDFRNTLYWKPDLHTGKDGKTEIDFFTSDESAEYTIIVEGISADGKTGYSTGTLNVK